MNNNVYEIEINCESRYWGHQNSNYESYLYEIYEKIPNTIR
jgi:hypothetical protein